MEKRKFYLSENGKVFKEISFYLPLPRNIKRIRVYNDGKIAIEHNNRLDEITVNEESGEIEIQRIR